MMACPYQNRHYWGKPKDTTYFPQGLSPYEETAPADWQRATIQKCDFCHDRLEQGLDPACVVTCPTRARTFGDLDDPNSEVSRLMQVRKGFQVMPELGTDPSVYYIE
jgi:molybdopterin-containing oxidoreductase family iron-sulfur binding subunit